MRPGSPPWRLHRAVVHAHPVQHPLADVEDQVGLLGERNELRGRNVAVARQAPAQQRLGADDAPVAQVHLGLVVDHQLVALQRAAQLALEHQPLDRRGVHLRGVEGEGIAAVLLGVVHRRIGVADQVDDVLRIARAEGDADAGGEEHLVLVQLERAADLGEHRARQLRDRAAVVGVRRQAVHEQRELIAGEAPDHRVLGHRARQALGQHLQHAIAGAVAEGVVDLLEAIHVQVQRGHHLAVAQRRARWSAAARGGTACGWESWSARRSGRDSGCAARRACAR